MCGIAGTAGPPGPDPEVLLAMARSMAHRGPDGEGTWWDDRAGLAFRRLAIIDLKERSNQPMHLGALHLVFNGEIYNYKELRVELLGLGHRFETEGDAEVLLHAWAEWGEESLDRLNGMFGFAVWDSDRGTLSIASDPFGEKPVYYAVLPNGRLVFGSDIRAVLCDPGVRSASDSDALQAFLAFNAMPAPAGSFFRDVERLPAAHLLTWRDGAFQVSRYWSPSQVAVPDQYPEAVRELREILADSIALRLRSDVPVGTSLSGGVDSSAVVAIAGEASPTADRQAFTASFPGFARDEWKYADAVARAAGTRVHHRVEPTEIGALSDLETLVWSQEEPVGSLSIYAQMCVMEAARRAGVTVLLDGQGGDELFGGYAIAPGFALRSEAKTTAIGQLARSPRTLAPVAESMAMNYLPAPLRKLYRRTKASPYAAAQIRARTDLVERTSVQWSGNWDPLRQELLSESFVTSLPQLLRYADRSSMAESREVRLPLLDKRVAQFAWSLPAEFVYRDGVTKAILRDAIRGIVPEAVIDRRDKVGFEPPQARWLNDPSFRQRVAVTLLSDEANDRGIYDRHAIETDLAAGSWRDPAAIWRALNSELWLSTFF